MKKLLSLLLTAALLLSVLAVPAGAAADSGDDGPVYRDIGHLSEDQQASIEWLYHNNIMLGTGEGKFSPNALFTRSMFVTMMGRLENQSVNEPGMEIESN